MAFMAAPVAAQERSLALGREATSRLGSPGDLNRSGRPYHVWTFRAESSLTAQFVMQSSAFDAYLVLQDGDGQFIAMNDNGETGSKDAKLIRDIQAGRSYRIIARSSTDSTGEYTLAVRPMGATDEGVVGTVTRGQDVNSTLSSDAPKVDGRPYRAWYFQAAAGDSITIDLTSDAFDTFLIVQDAVGRELASNDDFNGTLHSHVAYRFQTAGRYRILATVFDRSASGAFLLKVR